MPSNAGCLILCQIRSATSCLQPAADWCSPLPRRASHALRSLATASPTCPLLSLIRAKPLKPRHIDKNVWRLPIPKFDPDDPLHMQLVDLAAKAEEIAAGVDAGTYGFQKHRRLVRDALAKAGITEPLNAAVKTLLGEDG